MIVLYLKDNNQFLQAIMGFPKVKEEGNKLLFADGKVIINDLTKAGYREYPDQEYKSKIPFVEDEFDNLMEQPITIAELELKDFTPEELQDDIRVKEILSHSSDVITQSELGELAKILGKRLGY